MARSLAIAFNFATLAFVTESVSKYERLVLTVVYQAKDIYRFRFGRVPDPALASTLRFATSVVDGIATSLSPGDAGSIIAITIV